MRCDASWRGGESCFSPVCCSLSSYGRRRRCVCPPPSLPPLICCLFCFLSVLSPKRFGKVQISALTAQCSKRKGKNKRVAGAGGRDGGGEEAQALALARPEHGDWCPGAGLALRTQGLVASFSWESFAHLCSVPLCWLLLEGGLEKQGFFLLLHSLGWEPKRIPTLCSWS